MVSKSITFMVNFYCIYGWYYIYGFYYIYGLYMLLSSVFVAPSNPAPRKTLMLHEIVEISFDEEGLIT